MPFEVTHTRVVVDDMPDDTRILLVCDEDTDEILAAWNSVHGIGGQT